MKKKAVIRNILIVFAAAILSVAAAEIILGAREKAELTANYADAAEENDALFSMALEREPVEDIASTLLMRRLLESAGTPLSDGADYRGYPLIADMPRDDIYDEDTVEIVVLGDSFVWGYSCTDRNEVFWRLLENSLRAKGYNVRVDAVATPGANSYEELAWLTESSLVRDLKPDLVVFGYICNDPETDEGSRWDLAGDGGLAEDVTLVDVTDDIPCYRLLNKLLPNITRRLKNYVTAKTLYDREGEYLLTDTLSPILKGKNRAYFEEHFAKPLDDFAGKAPFRTVVMNLPPYPDNVLQKALYAPLHEIFGSCGNVTFYDCLDAFCHDFAAAKHKNNYSINAADQHPGSATNYFYATYLEQVLTDEYADMFGEPTGEDLRPNALLINDWLPYGVSPRQLSLTRDSAEYTLAYPSEIKSAAKGYSAHGIPISRYFLKLALGEEYIRVSFAQPVDLASVEISADGASDIELYYARIDGKLGYDDHTLLPFGTKAEDGFRWTDGTDDRVTGLCIRAEFPDRDGGELRVTVHRARDERESNHITQIGM
ncbi:MAG: SGNH/GDSL hydrolase family protein [Clostridia bacterium]|nr:SGNH/GDSL hydrolase family protein [Clostridia bacterium]